MEEIDKPEPKYKIIGINVLVMVLYSVLIRVMGQGHGSESILGVLIFLALILALHIVVCLINAAVGRRKGWLLSALAVLLLGFSTCAAVCSI